METAPVKLAPGDYAPWFHAAALSGNSRYSFDSVAGRMVVMLFFGQASRDIAAQALSVVARNRGLFDDRNACFFGVTIDPSDAREGRVAQSLPGIRFFLDYDRAVSRSYGAMGDNSGYTPFWLVLDRALRIVGRFPITSGEEAIACLEQRLGSRNEEGWAPVISVPDILEPQLCRDLVDLYCKQGGEASGFMRDIDGKTRLVVDGEFKRRRDCTIGDESLRAALSRRIERRLVPAIQRSFQFRATRIERYIVACYEAGHGHFRPHRDNTTFGTAHRRFAVTINLNADEYEGGDLRFPEFGDRTYRAPTGGAIVFSCSLLHEATPVQQGTRYAFLPFLYDDEAARLRAKNLHLLDQQSTAGESQKTGS